MSSLIVGMAPGGWITVWFATSDFDKFENIEVAKAQLSRIKRLNYKRKFQI
jgi:hypothetical protein